MEDEQLAAVDLGRKASEGDGLKGCEERTEGLGLDPGDGGGAALGPEHRGEDRSLGALPGLDWRCGGGEHRQTGKPEAQQPGERGSHR